MTVQRAKNTRRRGGGGGGGTDEGLLELMCSRWGRCSRCGTGALSASMRTLDETAIGSAMGQADLAPIPSGQAAQYFCRPAHPAEMGLVVAFGTICVRVGAVAGLIEPAPGPRGVFPGPAQRLPRPAKRECADFGIEAQVGDAAGVAS